MRLTRRGRGLVAGLGIAIAGILGHAVHEEVSQPQCERVEFGENETGVGTWNLLMEQGWMGVAGDDAEALYSPACWEQGTDAGMIMDTTFSSWDVDTASDQ